MSETTYTKAVESFINILFTKADPFYKAIFNDIPSLTISHPDERPSIKVELLFETRPYITFYFNLTGSKLIAKCRTHTDVLEPNIPKEIMLEHMYPTHFDHVIHKEAALLEIVERTLKEIRKYQLQE